MLEIVNWENPSGGQIEIALYGMRNPLESWGKHDSDFGDCRKTPAECIGENNLGLARRLISAGPEHRKFLRQIPITAEITAPEYFWRQMDQYKVSTVTDSTSQIHTLLKREFRCDDFSADYTFDEDSPIEIAWDEIVPSRVFGSVIAALNKLRRDYLEAEDPKVKEFIWHEVLELVPQSFNYTKTWSGNYETLFTICSQRAGHKLGEWGEFIHWALDEVYCFRELCLEGLLKSPNFREFHTRECWKPGEPIDGSAEIHAIAVEDGDWVKVGN